MTIRLYLIGLLFFSLTGHAETLVVTDEQGLALPGAMVTRTPQGATQVDTSDNGYPAQGMLNRTHSIVTRFTDADGSVSFPDNDEQHSYRVRAQSYQDTVLEQIPDAVVMQRMSPQQVIAHFPSNVWLSQLRFGDDEGLRKRFMLNCAFCHQQASPFMRSERTTQQWVSIIKRMNSYGARVPAEDFEPMALRLQTEYRELRENPEQVPAPRPWEAHLAQMQMTEWEIGDGFSQMHDFLLHPNGFIYIGDNLFDRIYELNPDTGEYTVYKVPHSADDKLGGILGHRFEVFPKMENYYGVHSFSYSKKDGNIFITPSMQQSLLEFDVTTKKFIKHDMPGGFYPHTIRTDEQDRVWFTLALSSQVAMYDRSADKFTLYDLPARGIKEWLILKSLPLMFRINPKYRPQPSPDMDSTGLPMPYGIDVAPNGDIWVARLYANDLAKIDGSSGEIKMVDFPFEGPRRLRIDANGHLWIVAFQDSLLVKYDPDKSEFTEFPLPVINEIPYALNVDRDRAMVWVNGNQSDTIMSFDINTQAWKVYPMPRQRFFTRDIEISETDGSVYTTNSHFPTWQSEGGVPTLLRISPVQD